MYGIQLLKKYDNGEGYETGTIIPKPNYDLKELQAFVDGFKQYGLIQEDDMIEVNIVVIQEGK